MTQYRPPRPVWPFVLVGSVFGLAFLAAIGVGVYTVRAMSDPETSLLIGIRIDGTRVSVKAPVCPADRVGTVEVYDSDAEKLLWRARRPRTPEGERGAVTLWQAGDFLAAGPGARPRTLPATLDVSVAYADRDGGADDVFDLREVRAARVPADRYWTHDGPRTDAQIDAQLRCDGGGPAEG
ncbi:hypothetical protein ACF09H_04625 [Streptomyces sp. NPDC014983]|uniref:hypothetical protein n=1 Tax=Streptomyces sp. NPDC014983 TaxID=3364933 RepID=UPI0036FD5A62